MAQYRKKPVVIEAFQWTGGPDQTEDPVWACEAVRDGRITFGPCIDGRDGNQIIIHTLEGTMRGDVGYYIIKGVMGELYPCNPEIFEATYEAA